MKTLITLLFLAIQFSAFAADLSSCKTEANSAAVEAYVSKFGEDSIIFAKSKFKPLVEGNNVTHFIQILDNDRGSNDILTVTLDKINCRVISID